MYCDKCGYKLDAFDNGCPRCHGNGIEPGPVARPRRSWRPVVRKPRLLAFRLFLLSICLGVWLKAYTHCHHDEVLEAVLRHRLDAGAQCIIFVSIDGHDPPPEFLSHFTHDTFTVRKWSQARIVPAQDSFRRDDGWLNHIFRYDYTDKATGETGVPMTLQFPLWVTPFRALVFTENAFSDGYYIVAWRFGRWVVTGEETTVMY
jgi:hypothetical protein